jgi:hypothetical protein
MPLPLTAREQLAKDRAEVYLAESKKYLHTGDLLNARSCAREGLEFIVGIPFPFAVRDQLHDVLKPSPPAAPRLSQERSALPQAAIESGDYDR